MSLTKVSGSILKDPLNLGHVSIGGTLTYQDVTNIDSVGIVTARSGIHVGAGVSAVGIGTFSGLDISGDIDVDGHTELDNVNIAGVATITDDVTTEKNILTLVGTSWGDGEKVFTTYKRGAVDLGRFGVEADGAGQAGQLIFECGYGGSPVERLRITSDGKVGIGTNNPDQELTLWSNSPAIKLVDTDPYEEGAYGTIAQSGGVLQLVADSGNTSSHGSIFFYSYNDNDSFNTYRISDNVHQWYISGEEKARLHTNGYLGIGTNNPQAPLETYKSGTTGYLLRATADLTISGTHYYRSYDLKPPSSNSTEEPFSWSTGNSHAFQVDGVERLRIDSTGKVKIGSGTASLALLHIAPADYSLNLQNNSSNKSMILFAKNSAANDSRSWIEGNGELAGYVAIGAGDAERLRVHSSGKLQTYNTLTSSASSFLQLGDTQGSFDFEMSDSSGGSDFIKHVKKRFVGKNTYGLTITSRSTLGSSYTKAGEASIKWYYPSAGGGAQAGGQLEFWTNQNGYAGTTEAKRMQIDNGGNIGAPNGNNIYNASDERLKENMVELTNGLDKIKKLKPISFNWKDGWVESLSGKKEYGFGAQTTQAVDEMLVEPFGTEDALLNGEVIKDPLRVNEKYITPLLVKAIQEQQEQIETLKAEVAALKSS